MHGGAKSGAPPGSRNALKHGLFTRQELDKHRALQALIRAAEATLKEESLT